VSLFVAAKYVITIRHGGELMLDAVRGRTDRSPSMARGGGTQIAYAVLDDLLTFRRAVAPLRDVLGRVVHVDHAVLGVELDAEFRDLYDHVLRVYDELDTQRDLLTGILEAHLSVVSNRLNEVVLKLSSWAAIVLVPTLIAGIYGMNFDRMPELHWRLGYPYALGLMVLSGVVLWTQFRKAGWL
jgi:magnesium transporter